MQGTFKRQVSTAGEIEEIFQHKVTSGGKRTRRTPVVLWQSKQMVGYHRLVSGVYDELIRYYIRAGECELETKRGSVDLWGL